MKDQNLPIAKSDVYYNAATQEVTLRREKFDALIVYVQGLVEQVSAADDERDVAEYRERRAKASESLLQEMVADVTQSRGEVGLAVAGVPLDTAAFRAERHPVCDLPSDCE